MSARQELAQWEQRVSDPSPWFTFELFQEATRDCQPSERLELFAALPVRWHESATARLERQLFCDRLAAGEIEVGSVPSGAPPTSASETPRWPLTGTRTFREDDPLKRIPPEVYIELLTGEEARVNRKVNCPFHGPERTPSLHVYADHWNCFGCGRGGDVYDFAGGVWGLSPRTDFPELRLRLLEVFGG